MTRTPPTRQAQGAERRRVSQPRLDTILPRLRNARRLRDGSYMACCPAHSDENPSLSLRELPDGTLLWHCHAGCSQEAVGEALRRLAGLDRQRASRRGNARTPSAEREERPESHELEQGLTLAEYCEAKHLPADALTRFGVEEVLYDGRPALAFRYWDRDGELRAVQYRLSLEGSDRFRWRRGDAPRLYGEWRVAEWLSQGEATLWAVEGSSDTLTMWCAGYACLGFPSASSARLASGFWQIAQQFERVVLCFDSDSAGAELLAAVADACPRELRERAFGVQLPNDTKDLSELWCRLDGDAEQFREAIRQLGNSATPLRNFPSFRVSESRPRLKPLREILASREGCALEFIDLLGVSNLIARGCTTLIVAHAKAGKTTLLVHACRHWLAQGLRIAYLSEESSVLWARRVEQFPELAELYLNEAGYAPVEEWADAIRAIQPNPDVVVIDVARRFLNIGDESDSGEVSRALRHFTELAHEMPRLALVVVHHSRKSAGLQGASVLDAAGSHAFAAEVDALLMLLPGEHERQRVLVPVAGRFWHPTPPPLCFELSEDGREYLCLGEAQAVAVATAEREGKQAVLDALHMLGESTASDVAEFLQANGSVRFTKQWVQALLNQLVQEGRVMREGSGRRGDAFRYRLPCGSGDSETRKLGNPIKKLSEFSKLDNAASADPSLVRVSDNELEQFARLLEESDSSASDDEFTLWASML